METLIAEPVDFQEIIEYKDYPCITIYIENHHSWPKNISAMHALRSQLKMVNEELYNLGIGERIIKTLLLPSVGWSIQFDYWRGVSHSLIFLISKYSYFRVFETNIHFRNSHHISNKFYLDKLVNKDEQILFPLQ